jgi:hypothetical protein
MRNQYRVFLGSILLFALVGVGAGCGNRHAQPQGGSFDQASPEIRADWETAVAADQTNGYYAASTGYAKVLSQESQLTPKQLALVEAASRDLSQRMVTAAKNGDDSAQQALKRLMRDKPQH